MLFTFDDRKAGYLIYLLHFFSKLRCPKGCIANYTKTYIQINFIDLYIETQLEAVGTQAVDKCFQSFFSRCLKLLDISVRAFFCQGGVGGGEGGEPFAQKILTCCPNFYETGERKRGS